MNITRDIVKDLLPVYLAGDASRETRDVVDEWLKSDPELAGQVEAARRADLPPVAAPHPSGEKRALDRTRRHLQRRGVLLGAAVYFSTLPFAFTFGSGGYRGLLLDDWLGRGVAIATAAVLWAIYWWTSRPLRAAGL